MNNTHSHACVAAVQTAAKPRRRETPHSYCCSWTPVSRERTQLHVRTEHSQMNSPGRGRLLDWVRSYTSTHIMKHDNARPPIHDLGNPDELCGIRFVVARFECWWRKKTTNRTNVRYFDKTGSADFCPLPPRVPVVCICTYRSPLNRATCAYDIGVLVGRASPTKYSILLHMHVCIRHRDKQAL